MVDEWRNKNADALDYEEYQNRDKEKGRKRFYLTPIYIP